MIKILTNKINKWRKRAEDGGTGGGGGGDKKEEKGREKQDIVLKESLSLG